MRVIASGGITEATLTTFVVLFFLMLNFSWSRPSMEEVRPLSSPCVSRITNCHTMPQL